MGPCAALGLLLAATLASAPARAQTTECDDSDSPNVVCTGIINEGFDAGDEDGLDVTVTDATMTNGTKTDTIRLNDQSSIVIEDSDVRNVTAGGVVAAVGDDGDVTHLGDLIGVEGVGGIGISAGDRASVVTGVDSIIDLIAADTIGIRVLDDDLGVINNGDIGGDQDGSIGIQVGEGNVVTNGGSILLNGANARGVLMGADNTLNVSGTIRLTGAAGWGVAAGTGSTVNNAGSIAVEGDGSYGVLLGADATLNILSDGEISAMGDGSVGVLAGGGVVGTTILNLGKITAGAGAGPAVSFAFSGPDPDANVLDSLNGSLIDAGVMGIAVLGSEATERFTSSGTIIGAVNLLGGDDVLELFENADLNDAPVDLGVGKDTLRLFGGGVFSHVDGGLGVEDIIELTIGVETADSLDLSKISNFERLVVDAGDWTLQGDADFSSGIELAGGVLRIADPVALSGNMEAFALSTLALEDTLELTGDYTQDALSTFAVALGSGSDGLLDVTGSATIADGASLGIIEETPLSGSFTILRASGGIVGTFSDLPEATPVLSFSLEKMDMDRELVLNIDRNSYAAGATTRNQRAVGEALDGVLLAGPDESMQELLASLDRVSFADYGAALDSLQPEAYDAQTSAMLGFGDTFARLAASNLSECAPAYYPYLPTWITSGPPCNEDGWTPWIGGFGSFGDRNGGRGHVDYSGQGGGVAVGAGRSFGSDWDVSGYVGGGFGSLDVKHVGDGSLQTFELGVGAVRRFGPFSLRGVVDYGHGWHQQDRHVVVGTYEQRPSGEYQSNRVTGMVEAAWQLVAAETNFFEPVGSVDFSWIDEESFKESGGSAADLAVGARSNTVVSTTLGIRLVRTFLKGRYTTDWAQWANGTWRPELDLRWRANWTDVDRDISARFISAPQGTGSFTVKGQDAKQGAEFAIGTTYQPYKTQALVTAGYRGFVGDGTQTHIVGAEVRIPF